MLSQWIGKRYYKTLGTSVINSPMSPPSLSFKTLPLLPIIPMAVIGIILNIFHDKQGYVTYKLLCTSRKWLSINFRYVGRNFSSLLNTLTAIQTIDSDDVIIPAGWKPADKTIKNTPDGIYDYYGISGNTITTGSLVQSEKAKSSVKYSESGVDVLEPALPNEDPSMTASKKSSSRASPAVIIPAPAPPSSAKSSKSSTTKASSLKSSKPSSIKEASVKSESSKTPSRLGSDRGLEVASVGSKKESSHPSQSPSTPSKPASSTGKVSSKGIIIISGLNVLLFSCHY